MTVSAEPNLSKLAQLIATDRRITGMLRHLDEPNTVVAAQEKITPWLLAALARKRQVLAITATGREAEELAQTLSPIFGEDQVAYFPSWETLPHERLSPGVDTVGQRAQVLHQLATNPQQYRVVIAAARAFCQPIVKHAPGREPLVLKVGQEYAYDEIAQALTLRDYQQVDMVARRGQYAIRGMIIDIFPTTAASPVRLEFFGDELTEIRQFNVADQRSVEAEQLGISFDVVSCFPARELPVSVAVQERAAKLLTQYSGNPSLQEVLVSLSAGSAATGMEAIMPVLTDSEFVCLPEFFPAGVHVVQVGPGRISKRIADLVETDAEFLAAGWEAAAMGAAGPLAAAGLDTAASGYRSYQDLKALVNEQQAVWWELTPTGMIPPGVAAGDLVELSIQPAPAPNGDPAQIEALYGELRELLADGGTGVFLAPAAPMLRRQVAKFRDAQISCEIITDGSAPLPGKMNLYQAYSHSSCVVKGKGSQVMVLTETDLTGNRVGDLATTKRRRSKKRTIVDPLALQPGDFVVHETHGIGRFLKLTERTIGVGAEASRREYVVLEYAPQKRGGSPDQLYVPMDSLDLLSRYVGGENPTLSKMGGSDWSNTKRKARAAVREIAQELVQLYAKRQASPGFAFSPDSTWQQALEDNFPYVETEDQLKAIEEVKADMEQPVPMDRVVIGDVGYGKTEVAVRAAFKAVQDQKQVAVLVPTTLLAQQHYATFVERMEEFPVRIKELSRFTSRAEVKEITAGLACGEIDIVIGTHRLLQNGIQWQNLGLIIVDEEQRFGVEHKEHIKALKTAVDVLTMSATPIPRTLEMSMAGIREMSTILTPPEDRHPVLTYVGAQEEAQIAAAIRRELLRDGQVFYVHNRVQTIEKRAAELRQLLPEARIVVAHGRMSETQLERTVQGFWDREYDVLVCTTIVETGLDIANANTLIVENAQNMGLSQLHQLRGRVGRSRERAYAYFLYPQRTELSETAYDRLATIAQNNDLGAGMAVAMKDLQMRGAGNVLGVEQSGHIAGVGFDLYVRLVSEAVETFRAMAKGEPIDATEAPREVTVDLPIDAHIPETYVDSQRLRLEMYRKLAAATDEAALIAVKEEMLDRFGPLPEPVSNLFAVARLRNQARRAGLQDISVQGTRMKIGPVQLPDSKQLRLSRLYPGATYRPAAQAINVSFPRAGKKLTDPQLRDVALLQWVADFLTAMFDVPPCSVTGASGEVNDADRYVVAATTGPNPPRKRRKN